MRIGRKTALFALGGAGYTALELIWRGRSHVSMFALGGVCFLLLGQLRKRSIPAPIRPIAGAALITAAELSAGLLWNRRHRIWDYSRLPVNYRGQICLGYSLLWIPVSMVAMWLYPRAERLFPSGKQMFSSNPAGMIDK